MRHFLGLLVVAGCGFKSGAKPAMDAPPLPLPDGGTAGMWQFDTAADFAATGSTVSNMTIEARDTRGSLTPSAYTYGGLAAHGLAGVKLWMHGDLSWAKLNGKTASGAGLWAGQDLTDASELDQLGIPSKGNMTLWFEGEVWLEAGSTELFKLVGDDVAFFQIALPDRTDYGAASDDNNNAIAVATPTTGWYPIRIGFTNGGGASGMTFTHSDTGGALVPWTRERLRARTSELPGALRTVFGRQLLAGGVGSQPPVPGIEAADLLTSTTFTPAPPGAPSNSLDWSARYLGQIYIVQPGTYTLSVTSDDGSRARLGSGRNATHWGRDDSTAATTYTTTAMLAAGWNDVAVDYNQTAGGMRLEAKLAGPDFAVAAAVPASRLRPVEAADDRLAFVSDPDGHAIKDGQGLAAAGTAALPVGGYANETVTAIDLTYEITTGRWNELKVDLVTPAGTRVTVQNTGGGDADGVAQLSITPTSAGALPTLLGGPANGAWRLDAYDVVGGGGDSLLRAAKLTLHTTGGPDKVARTAEWTSQVLDAQTGVFAIDGITWDERLPAGASVEVHIRTCQQADCSDGVWSAPVAKATGFLVDAGRYVQLRVDLSCDGALEPELRSLGVAYRRNPG